MSQPFIGEIRMFGGSFAPQGWAFCEGQTLAIAQNDALFALIGTTYGGDGQNTFNLPDFRGRIPIHQGNGFTIGERAGVESVTLTVQQMPVHTHAPQCKSTAGELGSPQNAVWAASTTNQPIYSNAAPNASMNATILPAAGGSQPHNNMAPFLAISFIISLFGIFPTQS
ncbi:MAG TPA: tail fiber protein [Blastocatellia bacterium]|nr:tail fiber protein [Blastocatellia bacterium]